MNILHGICSVALCALLCYSSLYAQDCAACATQKYVYIGCDMTTGSRMSVCTDNPRSVPNFRSWKKCFPMTITFGDFPPELDYILEYEKNGQKITIFDEFAAKVQATVALNQWRDICPPDNQNCINCNIRIIWATRETDMQGDENIAWAKAWQPILPTAGTQDCSFDCAGAYIAINLTPRWITKKEFETDPRKKYKQYLYTNRLISSADKGVWDDFYSLIQHELGHWLGFGHPYNFGCNMNGGGIMDRWGPDETNLNFHDKCMFMKLYCCPALTDVQEPQGEYQQVGEVKVYPNPATNTISVTVPESYVGTRLHIYIQNLIGQVVYEGEVQADSRQQSLPVNFLRSGSYYISISNNRGSRSNGVVVIEK